MKAIMIMYDSLNRKMMPNYGFDKVDLPNFKRLGEKTITFDNCYVGSMPCMPARRELHTGRYNFLHRSWGPIEPFDDSMPEILRYNGVHSHLSSDHYHYLEDGGATYHQRYSTWSIFRGQEGDRWKGRLRKPEASQMLDLDKLPNGYREYREKSGIQDMINREFIKLEEDFPQSKTFSNGLDFIDNNHDKDGWFLQIETFDPHEPFYSPDSYQEEYDCKSSEFDWPPYAKSDDGENLKRMKEKYYSLLKMCDSNLGKVLDMMDKHDFWKDTMLIVNTDHGFLLGEHNWYGKAIMPLYNEVAHTPLFIWDPRIGCSNERRSALVQTIDIAPTLLDFFGVEIPKDMQGSSLKKVIFSDEPVRDYALYGYHGDSVNITDGRYVYYRAPVSVEEGILNEYTLIPTHMNQLFSPNELKDIELYDGFSFTKGCKVMKIPVKFSYLKDLAYKRGHQLYDLSIDGDQKSLCNNPDVEKRLIEAMKDMMEKNDAPIEQFKRIGIE